MPARQTRLPLIWLITDLRNDAVLEAALARLPRGSGLIFRHYHLDDVQRRARFDRLRRWARARGHVVVLAGPVRMARRWGADGAYGPARLLVRGAAALRLVTAHSLAELGRARRADAVLVSPVFPTRSHPGGSTLGLLRFHFLAARAQVPVIALGGMGPGPARRLGWPRWAAIDNFLA